MNRERLDFDYPAILASNHPNTLLDPLFAAGFSPRQSFFLANAGLFSSNFMRWLWTNLYCIPIERPIDVGGRPIDNKASFQKSYDHLAKGGMIYVAPEAYSYPEMRVRPLKTGSARILLAAEEQNDFSLNSHLVPVAINYEQPWACGSRVLVRVGEAIRVADYKADYEQDERATVRAMTDELAKRLQDMVLQTADEGEGRLLRKLQRIWQNTTPLDVEQHHFRSQQLLKGMQQLRANEPASYQSLQAQTNSYCKDLERNKLLDIYLVAKFRPTDLIGLLIGGIIAAYGWLNHYLPIHIPVWIEKAMKLHESYRATVKYGTGLLIFPLLYALQTWLVSFFVTNPWYWLYLFSLPVAGWFTRRYWTWAAPKWGAMIRKSRPAEELEQLFGQRQQLIDQVQSLYTD